MFDQDNYEDHTFKELVIEKELIEQLDFQDCVFEKCTFTESQFKACKFKDCAFNECDLSLVRVDHSIFKGVTFEHCKVIGVNWAMASWGNHEIFHLLNSIAFSDCVLNYSVFVGLDLAELSIKKCVAREADFSEATLKKADFQGTDFEVSRFRNTDLTEANFVGARNYYIDPSLNTITKAKFSIPEAMSLLYSMDIELVERGEDMDE